MPDNSFRYRIDFESNIDDFVAKLSAATEKVGRTLSASTAKSDIGYNEGLASAGKAPGASRVQQHLAQQQEENYLKALAKEYEKRLNFAKAETAERQRNANGSGLLARSPEYLQADSLARLSARMLWLQKSETLWGHETPGTLASAGRIAQIDAMYRTQTQGYRYARGLETPDDIASAAGTRHLKREYNRQVAAQDDPTHIAQTRIDQQNQQRQVDQEIQRLRRDQGSPGLGWGASGSIFQRVQGALHLSQTGGNTSKINTDFGSFGQFLGQHAIRTAGYAVPGIAIGFGLEEMRKSLQQSEEAQRSFAKLQAQFQSLGQGSQLPQYNNQIRELASTTGLAVSETAQLALTMKGVYGNTQEAGQALTGATQAAVALNLTLAEAGKDITATTQAFADLSSKGGQGPAALANEIANAQNKFGVNGGDLLKGVADLAPVADAHGFSSAQTVNLVASTASRSGELPTTVAEDLSRVIPQFATMAPTVLNLYKQLPVLQSNQGIMTANLRSGNIGSAFEQFLSDFKKLPQSLRGPLAEELAGRPGYAPTLFAASEGMDKAQAVTAAGTPSDAGAQLYAAQMKTFHQQMQMLDQDFVNAGVSILNSGIGASIAAVAKSIGFVAEAFAKLNTATGGLLGDAAVFGAVALALRSVVNAVRGLAVFEGITRALRAMGVVSEATTAKIVAETTADTIRGTVAEGGAGKAAAGGFFSKGISLLPDAGPAGLLALASVPLIAIAIKSGIEASKTQWVPGAGVGIMGPAYSTAPPRAPKPAPPAPSGPSKWLPDGLLSGGPMHSGPGQFFPDGFFGRIWGVPKPSHHAANQAPYSSIPDLAKLGGIDWETLANTSPGQGLPLLNAPKGVVRPGAPDGGTSGSFSLPDLGALLPHTLGTPDTTSADINNPLNTSAELQQYYQAGVSSLDRYVDQLRSEKDSLQKAPQTPTSPQQIAQLNLQISQALDLRAANTSAIAQAFLTNDPADAMKKYTDIMTQMAATANPAQKQQLALSGVQQLQAAQASQVAYAQSGAQQAVLSTQAINVPPELQAYFNSLPPEMQAQLAAEGFNGTTIQQSQPATTTYQQLSKTSSADAALAQANAHEDPLAQARAAAAAAATDVANVQKAGESTTSDDYKNAQAKQIAANQAVTDQQNAVAQAQAGLLQAQAKAGGSVVDQANADEAAAQAAIAAAHGAAATLQAQAQKVAADREMQLASSQLAQAQVGLLQAQVAVVGNPAAIIGAQQQKINADKNAADAVAQADRLAGHDPAKDPNWISAMQTYYQDLAQMPQTIQQTVVAIANAQAGLQSSIAKSTGDPAQIIKAAQHSADVAKTNIQTIKSADQAIGRDYTNDPAYIDAVKSFYDAKEQAASTVAQQTISTSETLVYLGKETASQAIANLTAALPQVQGDQAATNQILTEIRQLQSTASQNLSFDLPQNLLVNPTLYQAARVNQTGSGGYNDNRQVSVVIQVNNPSQNAGAVQALLQAVGGPSTNGTVGPLVSQPLAYPGS